MRIVGRHKLDQFVRTHADTRQWISTWIAETEGVRWRTPSDIKTLFASASFLGDNMVIFNVKGNRYRMETLVAYNTGTVVIRWIGTHAEYSKRTN